MHPVLARSSARERSASVTADLLPVRAVDLPQAPAGDGGIAPGTAAPEACTFVCASATPGPPLITPERPLAALG